MSEEAYGAPTGDAIEGGTSNVSVDNVSTQEGSQPEGQEQQGNEQVITRKDLEAWEGRILEEASKRAQSMTDKMGSRLDKEIQSALDQAKSSIDLSKAAGVQFTPEQEQAVRDKAINNAYSRLNQQPDGASQPPPSANKPQEQGNQQSSPNIIAQEVHRIMAETGVYISANEANELIGQTSSPFEYIKAFEQIATQRQQNISQSQGRNPALSSYVTGGKAAQTQTALRSSYDKEIAQVKAGTHPSIIRGDTMGLQKLENSYRAKGLDI